MKTFLQIDVTLVHFVQVFSRPAKGKRFGSESRVDNNPYTSWNLSQSDWIVSVSRYLSTRTPQYSEGPVDILRGFKLLPVKISSNYQAENIL